MTELKYDTYCGLYCGACPCYIASNEGTLEELSKKFNRPVEELECYGCKITQTPLTGDDRCGILNCAVDRNLESCHECEDYPCDRLKNFQGDQAPHHSAIFKLFDQRKKLGVDAWFAEQKKRWSCTECESKTSWYDTTCIKCGVTLYSCKEEEKDLKKEGS